MPSRDYAPQPRATCLIKPENVARGFMTHVLSVLMHEDFPRAMVYTDLYSASAAQWIRLIVGCTCSLVDSIIVPPYPL